MVDIYSAIVLGLVEGLTEFLPISSTFHLIYASKALGMEQSEYLKTFEVVIQSGAILAVLLLYWKKFFRVEQIKRLILSFVPTALVGLALHKVIKGVFFEAELLQLAVFIGLGIVFIFAPSRQKEEKEMTYWQAMLIGLIQAMAVVPGVSRAGAVILGMSLLGFGRKQAAEYSFLLAVPTILAAGLLDVYKGRELLAGQGNVASIVIASGVAFVAARLSVAWFMRLNEKLGLRIWGYYRVIFGLILLGIVFI